MLFVTGAAAAAAAADFAFVGLASAVLLLLAGEAAFVDGDAALLTDELPPDAYADAGFVQFLKQGPIARSAND